MTTRLLILGGTKEARRLAEILVPKVAGRITVITSLAGRTSAPRSPPGELRIGGFGGAEGLARYLEEAGIDLVVDATHPYAARMGGNAARAVEQTGRPLLRLDRAPWQAGPGDDWHCFDTVSDLVQALPRFGRHALITLGGADLTAFSAARGTRLTVRAIDPPKPPIDHPDLTLILARGPFDLRGESTLLSERGIDMLVSRNAGGLGTEAKLMAARDLGLPVLLLARPSRPETVSVDSVEDAVHWVMRNCDRQT